MLQDVAETMADDPRERAPEQRLLGGVDVRPPLAEAKLAAPNVRRGTVERMRIREALDAGSDAALTLVSAPAGYGKTTAVRSWCASRDAALAWVTLDGGDNDPVRLWRYVATAVDRVRPGLGRGALQRLDIPGSALEDAVDELMNGIAAFGSELVVVLDDLHTVTNEECLASIGHALGHLPSNARLIAVTRVDPALRLAQLRAGGALAELRSNQLAFTPAEASPLLVASGGAELGAEEIGVLVERTEGWPAALVLAGLWLRTVDDPVSAARSFGGGHRFVAEYLSSEVLASLDEERRAFLHGAAVLGEFTAELCDAVLDRSDSGAQLDALERSNLFVQRLGRGGWFRIHSLFAEYARAQFASLDPAAPARIQRRAAEWLRDRGMPLQAVELASAAGDHAFVAEVLAEYHLPLVRDGTGKTFLRWAGSLPDESIVAHPEIAAAAAIASVLDGGSWIEQRRYLRLAEEARAGQGESSDTYVEAWVLVARALTIDGGVRRAVLDGRRAVALAQGASESLLGGALIAYSRALFFAGDLDEASEAARRVLEQPGIEGRALSLALTHSTLALVAVENGRLASARTHAERAKSAVGRIGTSRSWLGANAAAALGAVLAAEGHLAEGEQELGAAERFFGGEVPTLHQAWLLVLLARVRVRRGRLEQAEAALSSARETLAELADSGRVPALVDFAAKEIGEAKARAGGGAVLEPPSEAELSVLRLLDSELSAREIGERLFLSPNTIHSHTRALYHKLGVHSRTDAVARAAALGLLDEAESPG